MSSCWCTSTRTARLKVWTLLDSWLLHRWQAILLWRNCRNRAGRCFRQERSFQSSSLLGSRGSRWCRWPSNRLDEKVAESLPWSDASLWVQCQQLRDCPALTWRQAGSCNSFIRRVSWGTLRLAWDRRQAQDSACASPTQRTCPWSSLFLRVTWLWNVFPPRYDPPFFMRERFDAGSQLHPTGQHTLDCSPVGYLSTRQMINLQHLLHLPRRVPHWELPAPDQRY